MGFEDILRRRLGPMRELVGPSSSVPAPNVDPAEIWYRRAVGLEVRARPDESWGALEIGPGGDRPLHRLSTEEGAFVAGLLSWTHARDLPIKPSAAWKLVERDLLHYAHEDPGGPKQRGETGVLERAGDRPVARRASAWPTPAIEDPVRIAPMPFMPRGLDLGSAELVGMRFASRERGFDVFGATVTGSARTGRLLRALVPLLDGRRAASQILAEIPADLRQDAEKMLRLLDRLTVLELGGERPSEIASALAYPEGPQVTWLGHAGVLVQAVGRAILIDPLFFAMSDPPERWASAPRFDPRDLPPIDAVLITHGDNDHLNPSSLIHLPASTPIYIPAIAERPPPYQVDIHGVLRVLGFKNVVEVSDWDAVSVGGFTITACPFSGEDWGLDLAQATYLIEAEGVSVYCSADSFKMDETYKKLAERGRRVDLAFMGVSGCAESFAMPAELGYGNFYREWIPRIRHNEWVQHCAGPLDAHASLAIFEPRYAFGYASGGASYIKTAYSDTGDHAELEVALFEAGAKTRPVRMPLGRPVRIETLHELVPTKI